MEFWHGFLLITGIHLLAAISPGPDFIFVSQQTLSRGRKAGMICALGVALGLGIHITYSVLGLAVVIAQASWLLTAIKIVGGAYLIWLGVHGLRAKAKKEVTEVRKIEVAPQSPLKTLWKGFLCNVLNPKAPVYFVSVFTVVLSPDMPLWQLAIYGVWMMVLQFAWTFDRSCTRCRYGWFRYKSRFKLIKHFFMFISKAVCIYRRFLFT